MSGPARARRATLRRPPNVRGERPLSMVKRPLRLVQSLAFLTVLGCKEEALPNKHPPIDAPVSQAIYGALVPELRRLAVRHGVLGDTASAYCVGAGRDTTSRGVDPPSRVD